MAIGRTSADDESITSINVTPLVDVVLVLLIILMVMASYVAARAIPLELPAAGPPAEARPTLAISIDPTGALLLDAAPIEEDALLVRVRGYVREVGHVEARATIAADPRVTHGQVVHIIDVLRREHVAHFAIDVRPADLD